MQPQQLCFTRWVYSLDYECLNFRSYLKEHRNSFYSNLNTNRYELALNVEIEPFKNRNTKTKGVKLYFRNRFPFPYEAKDETGLRPTMFLDCYYGDIVYTNAENERNKVLVLFQVLKDEKKLIVDVFDGYYPKNTRERIKTIKQHEWYKKSTL
ncbi:MAG: hypothetical protein KDC90_07435 [Ignavibacteriae bacterium]|nr:hypothetical protein [Ignavibacteriota bacterium]